MRVTERDLSLSNQIFWVTLTCNHVYDILFYLSNIDTEYNSEDSFEQLSNQPRHV